MRVAEWALFSAKAEKFCVQENAVPATQSAQETTADKIVALKFSIHYNYSTPKGEKSIAES